MDSLKILTSQNVKIEYETAGPGDRLLAYFIDTIICYSYAFIMYFILSDAINIYNENDYIYYVLAIILPLAFYHLFCELILNGQSPGKKIMNLKVVRLDGSRPELSNYLVRWLFRIIEIYLFFGLALVILLIKGKGQRLGDVAAGTAVVRVKKQIALEDLLGTSSLNFIDSNKIIFDEVKDLNFAQYEVIIETYNWAKIKNNHKLINTLSDKIKETLKIKSDMLSTELVETVISDYQRINNM